MIIIKWTNEHLRLSQRPRISIGFSAGPVCLTPTLRRGVRPWHLPATLTLATQSLGGAPMSTSTTRISWIKLSGIRRSYCTPCRHTPPPPRPVSRLRSPLGPPRLARTGIPQTISAHPRLEAGTELLDPSSLSLLCRLGGRLAKHSTIAARLSTLGVAPLGGRLFGRGRALDIRSRPTAIPMTYAPLAKLTTPRLLALVPQGMMMPPIIPTVTKTIGEPWWPPR